MTRPRLVVDNGPEECPRCHGTGWWSEFYETGRDGCALIGGRCDRGCPDNPGAMNPWMPWTRRKTPDEIVDEALAELAENLAHIRKQAGKS